MIVMKFGGTSVGSAERIKHVATLVRKSTQPVLVVLSAMSGTTNTLVEIAENFYKKDRRKALSLIDGLQCKYNAVIKELYDTEEWQARTNSLASEIFDHLRSFELSLFTSFEEKDVIAQGEILSTNMMNNYLHEQGVDVSLLSALDFVKTDKNGEPDMVYITERLNARIGRKKTHDIYITQGFICRNAFGEIDNLLRGGSDYTASLLGVALQADEIQIWTDIDGMHNNDPRIVDNTRPIRQLYFDEAAELAYFGAKILHPICIRPAKKANIPVRLLNTMEPEAEGTLVNGTFERGKIKAIAAKDNVFVLKIKGSGRLMASGYLKKVFEVFESYQTAIDMISTSEVSVSVSFDRATYLNEIVGELKNYGEVSLDDHMCIICVVGDLEWINLGFEAAATEALKDIPLRMISYGGSNFNISYLIQETDKKRALQQLSQALFNTSSTGVCE
ncbi:MAG: aspartate kinase [Prevotellaceae bacterium]|nr:aspartate kinase [Prevotellaceae bacterium]